MERKEKGSDLGGEFREKESGKAKTPLASKEQGCQKTHPAEEKKVKSNDCVILQFFCVILLVHSSYLCNVYMLGLGGSGLLWLSKAAWNVSTMILH